MLFYAVYTDMAETDTPRVSIVMPTHNRAGLLSRAIESVRSQTFADWELVVTDDASTDTTGAVLQEWAAKDARIRPHRNAKNQYPDISGILNDGLARARGEYIARLDDDDYWIDTKKLTKQVAYLDAYPACVIVGTGAIVVDGEGNERYRYLKRATDAEIRNAALSSNPFTHSTVLYRKSIALEVGGYENQYAEDWTLWLALGKCGTMHNIQEYSIGYLMDGQNKSWTFQRAQYAAILGIVWRFRHDYPRFFRGFIINLGAYAYSFLPLFARKALHQQMSLMKRTL